MLNPTIDLTPITTWCIDHDTVDVQHFIHSDAIVIIMQLCLGRSVKRTIPTHEIKLAQCDILTLTLDEMYVNLTEIGD